MNVFSKRNIEILPLLLVIKVYTGFIMTASPYAIPYLGMFIYLAVLITVCFESRKYFERQSVSAKLCFICLIIYFSFVTLLDDFDYGKNTLYDICFLAIFFYMTPKYKLCTLQYFFNFGTILLLFSIVEYILYIYFGVGYTLGIFDRGESSTNEQIVIQGIFNYYSFNSKEVFRFQSLFREPGILGQSAGLVLFMWDKLDVRKCVVWLVAGLMSLSLFFYIFLAISVLYNSFNIIRKIDGKTMKVSYLIVFFFVIYAGYILIPKDFQLMITDRVENMSEDNTDNRSTDAMNMELDTMFRKGEFLFGRGAKSFYQKDLAWGNTGIKADLYKLGVFGVSLIIVCFWLLIRDMPVKSSNKVICFLLFCMLYYNGDIKYSLNINILLFSFLLMERTYKSIVYESIQQK